MGIHKNLGMFRAGALILVLVFSFSLAAPKGMANVVTFPTLYDDFRSEQIDPNRAATARASGYEMGIRQDDGRLKMALQNYGNGPLGFINLGMTTVAAAAATGIQVTARIERVHTTGCGSAQPGQSRAGLNAPLFRDGPDIANPNDSTGVVTAVNGLRVLANHTAIEAVFFAIRCQDFDCNKEFFLGGGTFHDVGRRSDGDDEEERRATLGTELDAAHNRVIFTKDDEIGVVDNASANQINTNLGPLQFKRLQVIHFLETCPTQVKGFISASFENFRTKP